MGRLCGGAHEISDIPALPGWVVGGFMGWLGRWVCGGVVGVGLGGTVGGVLVRGGWWGEWVCS